MLIGICGGICAGKRSVANYLIQTHGFQQVQLCDPSRRRSQDLHDHKATANGTSDNSTTHTFTTVHSLLAFVTTHYTNRYVLILSPLPSVSTSALLDTLLLRPFFLLVSIDAPISLRWRRYTDRAWRRQLDPPDLEKFILLNDAHLYDPSSGVAYFADRAQVRLFNSGNSLSELHAGLERVGLVDGSRLRPGWDQYFMELANLAALRSNCMKRRVGCVLVKERRVMATGYNGTPRGTRNCNQGGCPRCNNGHGAGAALSTCLCLHAEENALLEAGRERVGEGAILYCNTCPCLTCAVKIAQMGIAEVVFSQSYNMDKETAAVLKEAGVKLRQFSPPRNRLIDLKVSIKVPDSI